MKIRVEHVPIEENEVVLRCAELDEEMLDVLGMLRERGARLPVVKDGETHMLSPSGLLYADTVDGRTFVYTEEAVYQTSYTLAALEVMFEDTGLQRIGKSQLVNLYRVERLRSLPNSRIEVTLANGERLVVSRHFTGALKARLGVRMRGGDENDA